MKTILVRYRRWGLMLVILLSPIIYNIISNATSSNSNALGTFKMDVNDLNPQTILYRSDPSMENYFQAAVKSKDIALQSRSDNISQMNQYIRRKFFSSRKINLLSQMIHHRETNRSSIYIYGYLSWF